MAQLPTAFTANTVFVDGKYGIDATGLRERSDFPFQTLSAAISKATAGDTIEIRPNTSYPTISSAIVLNKANLTIRGNGVTLKAASETSPYVLSVAANGVTLDGLTIDGARTSSTTIQGGGTLSINNAQNVTLRRITVQNTTARGINLTGNFDGFDMDRCSVSNMYQGIGDDQASITGSGVRRIRITNCCFYNTWTDGIGGGYPGGIKLDNTSTTSVIIKAIISGNHIWGGHNNGPEEGLSVQGTVDGTVVSNNTVSNYSFNYTLGGISNVLVTDNTSRGGGFCAFENVDAYYCTYSNNVIDGKDDSGTITCQSGYSVSTNFSTQEADLNIVGGSIRNCITAIHSDRCSGIKVSDLITSVTGTPFYFQHGGNITVENTFSDVTSTSVYGISLEIFSGDTLTGFHFKNNTFRFTGTPGTHYPIFHFYCPATGTFNDVEITGTDAIGYSGFWGSGIVGADGSPTINIVTQKNNHPETTSPLGGQSGFLTTKVISTSGLSANGADFEIDDAGTNNSTAVRLFSNGGNLYLQSGTGGYVYFRNTAGATEFAIDGTNTTGSGSPALGSNSPATTNSAPYTWIKIKTADGSTAYIPAWK